MLNATYQCQNPTEPYYYRFMYIITKVHDKVCTDERTIHTITILTVNHLIPVPHKEIKTQSKEQRKQRTVIKHSTS